MEANHFLIMSRPNFASLARRVQRAALVKTGVIEPRNIGAGDRGGITLFPFWAHLSCRLLKGSGGRPPQPLRLPSARLEELRELEANDLRSSRAGALSRAGSCARRGQGLVPAEQ
ncbi:hypothetical protein SKAU_G00271820 [Synaphobranchus kaupii]|uniref:Uncharacterized protein n=1 Tax=Synaphobranchus kaupii TaxID=118154 RepID=A0A9Q1F0I3_SYNKA|nr:hypothetical protein SKAU_G00271820 [Synaphobranchus kaupii]